MKVGKRKLDFIENELCLVGLSPPKSLDQAADRENRFNTRVKPTFRFRMKLLMQSQYLLACAMFRIQKRHCSKCSELPSQVADSWFANSAIQRGRHFARFIWST